MKTEIYETAVTAEFYYSNTQSRKHEILDAFAWSYELLISFYYSLIEPSPLHNRDYPFEAGISIRKHHSHKADNKRAASELVRLRGSLRRFPSVQ